MTAKFRFGNDAHQFKQWSSLPEVFKSRATRWVYIGPDGSWWDLAGPLAGRQGVQFAEELHNAIHVPFEHLLTESAYQDGATYERSNITKRVINFGAMIGSTTRPLTEQQYRIVESRWWSAWPIGVFGWLGCHTHVGGWRWIKVMQAEQSDTSLKKDPVYAGNNCMVWDMRALAPQPWFNQRSLQTTWTAHEATVEKYGYDEEVIHIANRGDMAVWPKFIYTGPGRAWVQDGVTDNLIELPEITKDESPVLVQTDYSERMLTAASDPVDNVFYQLIRSSRVLDFFLHDIGDLGVDVWRRAGGVQFTSQIPPKTVANIRVRHNTAGGSVTVIMPQRFSRPY